MLLLVYLVNLYVKHMLHFAPMRCKGNMGRTYKSGMTVASNSIYTRGERKR